MARVRIVCASAVLAALLAGAGSLQAAAVPTKASWAASANRICKRYLTQASALPEPTGNKISPSVIRFFEQMLSFRVSMDRALAQIPRPADKKGLIRLYLVYESEQTAARKQVVAALKRGNLKRARQIDAHRSSQGPRASFAAFVLGAHLCQETVIG